ncbi:hypothetical protein Acr_02g0005640 [Actinidia rufa]|uniref:Uncharacterized protein n=1 Tax=Actinidia rufa TaxID=165716 RepID=A0A7J0E760_9ERIC|nr:hypothetical protein Acr_02g0005640 [Actinidia rufa]
MSKSNFPPYGTDFVNQMSTGRFSNGRLFPDFLAYYLGTEKYQQPYLDPTLNLREKQFQCRSSWRTSKQYKVKLQKKIGRKRAEDQIKKALFYVNAGSDDFALSYFGDGKGQTIRQKQYRLPDYEQFVVAAHGTIHTGIIGPRGSKNRSHRSTTIGLHPCGNHSPSNKFAKCVSKS